MDVVDAIMQIFADIFALNNYSGMMSDLLIGVMSTFFKGIVAFVEMIKNMYEVLGALQ